MAERRMPWVKLWADYVTSPSMLGLTVEARWVGICMMLLVRASADAADEQTTWALLPSGAPMSAAEIADYARMPTKSVEVALRQLEAREFVARRDDGAWGVPNFWRYQETKWAAQKRGQRADKQADKQADSPRQCPPDVSTEGRGQRGEDRAATQQTPPTPSRGVSSETRAEAAFLSHPAPEPAPAKGVPAKPRKPRDDYPEGLDRHLLGEIVLACRELGRRGPRVTEPTPAMRDDLRKLWAAERPTADDLTHAVRVRAAMDRAGEGYGEVEWTHLCVAKNFRRYRDREAPKGGRPRPYTPSDFGEDDT